MTNNTYSADNVVYDYLCKKRQPRKIGQHPEQIVKSVINHVAKLIGTVLNKGDIVLLHCINDQMKSACDDFLDVDPINGLNVNEKILKRLVSPDSPAKNELQLRHLLDVFFYRPDRDELEADQLIYGKFACELHPYFFDDHLSDARRIQIMLGRWTAATRPETNLNSLPASLQSNWMALACSDAVHLMVKRGPEKKATYSYQLSKATDQNLFNISLTLLQTDQLGLDDFHKHAGVVNFLSEGETLLNPNVSAISGISSMNTLCALVRETMHTQRSSQIDAVTNPVKYLQSIASMTHTYDAAAKQLNRLCAVLARNFEHTSQKVHPQQLLTAICEFFSNEQNGATSMFSRVTQRTSMPGVSALLGSILGVLPAHMIDYEVLSHAPGRTLAEAVAKTPLSADVVYQIAFYYALKNQRKVDDHVWQYNYALADLWAACELKYQGITKGTCVTVSEHTLINCHGSVDNAVPPQYYANNFFLPVFKTDFDNAVNSATNMFRAQLYTKQIGLEVLPSDPLDSTFLDLPRF